MVFTLIAARLLGNCSATERVQVQRYSSMTVPSSRSHRWAWRKAREVGCSQSKVPPGPQPQGLICSVCKLWGGKYICLGTSWMATGHPLGVKLSFAAKLQPKQKMKLFSCSYRKSTIYFLNSLKTFPPLCLSLVSLPGVTMSSLIPPQGRHQEEN